jgi:hypothetical protein
LRRSRNRSLQEPLSFSQFFSHASAQLGIVDRGDRLHISAIKVSQPQIAVKSEPLGQSITGI